jgi:hypothetical protein
MNLVTGHVPSGIISDLHGNIWVLCSGRGWNGFPAADDTPGRLICYDPQSHTVLKELVFPSADKHPDNLLRNKAGDVLYYNHPGGIFAFSVGSAELPVAPLVQRSIMLYGIGYDSVSDKLLGADAGDYAQNGWAYFYDPADGTPLDSFRTGVIPNGFWAGQ